MMTEKWNVKIKDDDSRIIYIRRRGSDDYAGEIAVLYNQPIKHARLIAAAPELFDALQFARTYLSLCAGNDPDALAYLERAQDALDKVLVGNQ